MSTTYIDCVMRKNAQCFQHIVFWNELWKVHSFPVKVPNNEYAALYMHMLLYNKDIHSNQFSLAEASNHPTPICLGVWPLYPHTLMAHPAGAKNSYWAGKIIFLLLCPVYLGLSNFTNNFKTFLKFNDHSWLHLSLLLTFKLLWYSFGLKHSIVSTLAPVKMRVLPKLFFNGFKLIKWIEWISKHGSSTVVTHFCRRGKVILLGMSHHDKTKSTIV